MIGLLKKKSEKKPLDIETMDEEIQPAQCEAYTKAGKKCRNKAVSGKAFCHVHRRYDSEGSLLSDVQQIMRDLSDE